MNSKFINLKDLLRLTFPKRITRLVRKCYAERLVLWVASCIDELQDGDLLLYAIRRLMLVVLIDQRADFMKHRARIPAAASLTRVEDEARVIAPAIGRAITYSCLTDDLGKNPSTLHILDAITSRLPPWEIERV